MTTWDDDENERSKPDTTGPQRNERAAPDDSEFGGVDLPAVLPPGQYRAVATNWRVGPVHGKLSLTLIFEVHVPDTEAMGGIRFVTLMRHYNIKRQNGRLKPPEHGDYTDEWILVAGRRPSRSDRMSPQVFMGVLVLVEVALVTIDRRGNRKPEGAEYSKVERIVAVIERKAPL